MVTTCFRRWGCVGLTLLASALVVGGCSSGNMTDSASSPTVTSSGAAPASPPTFSGARMAAKAIGASNQTGGLHQAAISEPQTSVLAQRQVIRHADLDIRVSNVEKSEKEVANIVTAVGGYTEKASSSDLASTHPVLTLALRVPVGSFEATISKFEILGVRLSKTISSDDVTGQLVDMDARLRTLRAQEDVYRDMLKNRTQLEDVFNIQSQLRDVRTQIETISGERKSQAGLASLSTINLTLEQNAVVGTVPADPNWFAMTLTEASSGAGSAFRLITIALVWAIAFCPFWIPIVLILRKLRKTPRTPLPF